MKPTSIVYKYLSKNFFLSLISVLFAVMGIILLFDTIELLRRSSTKDVPFTQVIEMGILKLPQMINMILPFAVMLGAMVCFWRLSKSNELVIVRSAGVSVWQFLLPVLSVAFLVGLVNITIVNPISAQMFKTYERMEEEFSLSDNSFLKISGNGLWLRESKGNGISAIVHSRTVRQDSMSLVMTDITIMEVTDGETVARRLEAQKAILKDNIFHLEKIWVITPGKSNIYEEKIEYNTNLTIGKIQEKFASPETLSFWDLPGFIKFFEASGFSANKHIVHWLTLMFSPFMLCSMVLVAAIFTLSPNLRQGKILFKIVGGVASGFIIYFLSRLVYTLGQSNTIPPIMAVWTPILVPSFISISVLLHLEDG